MPLLKSYAEVSPTCRTQRASSPLPSGPSSPVGRNRENSRCPTETPNCVNRKMNTITEHVRVIWVCLYSSSSQWRVENCIDISISLSTSAYCSTDMTENTARKDSITPVVLRSTKWLQSQCDTSLSYHSMRGNKGIKLRCQFESMWLWDSVVCLDSSLSLMSSSAIKVRNTVRKQQNGMNRTWRVQGSC